MTKKYLEDSTLELIEAGDLEGLKKLPNEKLMLTDWHIKTCVGAVLPSREHFIKSMLDDIGKCMDFSAEDSAELAMRNAFFVKMREVLLNIQFLNK